MIDANYDKRGFYVATVLASRRNCQTMVRKRNDLQGIY